MQVCSYAPTTRTRNLAPVENNDCFQELQPYILRPRPSLCTSVNLLLTIDRLKACCWLCSACMHVHPYCSLVTCTQNPQHARLVLAFLFQSGHAGCPTSLAPSLALRMHRTQGPHVAAQMQACTSIHHTEQTQHNIIPNVPPRHTWQAVHIHSTMQEVAATL